MDSLQNYINRLNYREVGDQIEVIDGEFIVIIAFHKNNISNGLLRADMIKCVKITRHEKKCDSIIERLYSFLSLSYKENGKIPTYFLGRDSNNQNNLFFEISFDIDQRITFKNFVSIISNFQDGRESVLSAKDNFSINQPLKESNELNIIQSNTKTRRLGYIKLIVDLFENSNYFPVTYLSKRIESDSILFNNDLVNYGKDLGDDKGLIKKTVNGSSAKPYIELSEELNLLTKVSSSYILTKQSKIYFFLNKSFKTENPSDKNLFRLDLIDKLFFLRQLLLSDPLYTWVIIDIISIADRPINTMSLKELFVDYVKNELDLNQYYSNSNSTKRKIIEIKKRISSWTKALIYLEHIVEPRINWLVDLGILEINPDLKGKNYILSPIGVRLSFVLSQLFEQNLSKQLILASFLKNNYFNLFNYIFDLKKDHKTLNNNKIDLYLLEAFKLFKTNAPNRIAASQGIDYVCFKSFFEDGIIIEFDELKKHLQAKNTMFSLDWFNTEDDGTLYLKK